MGVLSYLTSEIQARLDAVYAHAPRHAKTGEDPITPESIGAAALGTDGKVLPAQLPPTINRNLLDNWYFAGAELYAPSGTTYYSDTGLTTSAGTLSGNTAVANNNAAYGEVTVSGTIYYVAAANIMQNSGTLPVNQRGAATYTQTGTRVDRWIQTTGCKLTIVSDGIIVENESSGSPCYFRQMLEKALLLSGVFTASCFVEVVSGKPTIYFGYEDNSFSNTVELKSGLVSNTIVSSKSVKRVQFTVPVGAKFKLKAAKLEEGPDQTLARQDENGNWVLLEPPPDYRDQLAVCKRYYRLWTDAEARTQALKEVGLMRDNPSTGTIDIGGTTYYYASAEP